MPEGSSVLVIACGALVRELQAIVAINGLDHVRVECLPGSLHNRPELIPAEVGRRIDAADEHDEILVGYADCGTGGALDRVLAEKTAGGRKVQRLPGAHCYEFFATSEHFSALHEAELGTFYLTDYLARHFDVLVVKWLGLDRHPELRDAYFGNYTRLVYLAQTDDPAAAASARQAAERLGLTYETIRVGYGDLETSVVNVATRKAG